MQVYHLKGAVKGNLTKPVQAWREYTPRVIPLPSTPWRNNSWLRKLRGSK